MKALLETTSALCVRRLVRELNAAPDGFWYTLPGLGYGVHCNGARLMAAGLYVHTMGGEWRRVSGDDVTFSGPYGAEICASREA